MASNPDISAYCPSYAPPPRAFDEMCTPRGEVREHWRYLIQSLRGLGPDILTARRREAARLLRDDGASYNVYDTPGGFNRPWTLDPIPMLISSEEWARTEAGLLQRAELLNLVFEDLYGPRTLIKNGLLPTNVVHAHKGYLRPCVSATGAHHRGLTLYAADLARSPDGQVWVLNDRTQAPSGLGYALENRIIMSQIMPSLFRESHPHRLAYFFRALRSALAATAPLGQENPRIVVLTPGAHNETYFEHVFLANYLGYTLVEGGDLTVRDGRVWLKSLQGLEPVDVILRRVDDDYCDPLELRPESKLGVAGLVEMVRRGLVSVGNPLGAGVLENPALMPFLPKIAKHFLGHDLGLPSIATWWCGQAMERDYVLANLHRLVIRPIRRGPGYQPVFGDMLSQKELEAWGSRIKAHPYLYVGQERVELSSAPIAEDAGLEPRRAVVRSFLAAQGDSFVVLPGGLTRVGAQREEMVISGQMGAISKDTWVLASEPEKVETLWSEVSKRKREPGVHEGLPGRVAENLFWMARYAERAEDAIRLVRNIHSRLNETIQFNDAVERESLSHLLKALTHLTATYPGFVDPKAKSQLENPEQEVLDLILNRHRTGAVAANLSALLNASYSVRDLMSSDTWRVINDIEDELSNLDRAAPGSLGEVQDSLDNLVTALMALSGLNYESMGRELEWHFLCLGRRIERGLLIISLLRSLLVPAHQVSVEGILLESLLSTIESLALYRRRHLFQPQIESVLDVSMLDETNPRSLAFQLDAIRDHINRLPGQDQRPLRPEMRLAIEAWTELKLAAPSSLAQTNQDHALRVGLDRMLVKVSGLLNDTALAVNEHYFAHVKGPFQLIETQAMRP